MSGSIAEILAAEPFAGAPEAADHLVGDQQDVMLAADALDLRPIGRGRDDHAAGALDRLGDEGGDLVRADLLDRALELARRPQAEFLGRRVAALAIPIGLRDMDDARDRQAALRMHRLHAAERGAAHGRAVIAVLARHDDGFSRLALRRPEMAHHADDGVARFRARAGEEDAIESGRRDLREERAPSSMAGRWVVLKKVL